ncbi:MAG TPA: response regulator transcription factor [Draconibacterium sp.]|nr:response regulator transcription factor [Draconibacterium sp.]
MNRARRKKIVLINDNALCAEALKLLLNNKENGFQVTIEISALEKLQSCKVLNQADLVLLNAGLPFDKIIPITEYLKQSFPEIPSILFNARDADQLVLQCVMNGVRGIVWLVDPTSKLLLVCNKVVTGERYLGIIKPHMETYAGMHKIKNENLNKITPRELSVLKLFSKGYSYKKIGEELNISPRTVESHKINILNKLGLESLKELISYAIKNNMV